LAIDGVAAMNLRHLKISIRLVMPISVLWSMLISIGGFGPFFISQTNTPLKSVYEDRTVPMGQVSEIQQRLLHNRLVITNTLHDPPPKVIELDATITEIGKVWDAYMATTLNADEARIAKQFSEDRTQLFSKACAPL
jgi:methyl-accepting chemotaxis protein-1 (serine sensor receptor)